MKEHRMFITFTGEGGEIIVRRDDILALYPLLNRPDLQERTAVLMRWKMPSWGGPEIWVMETTSEIQQMMMDEA